MDLDDELTRMQRIADQSLEANAEAMYKALFQRIIRIASSLRDALEQAEPDEQGLYDALAATRGDLLEFLRTEGVTVFGRPGDPVDPQRHVVVKIEGPSNNPPIVMQVECEGLEWKSKVIRKAEVVTSNTGTSGNADEA